MYFPLKRPGSGHCQAREGVPQEEAVEESAAVLSPWGMSTADLHKSRQVCIEHALKSLYEMDSMHRSSYMGLQ